MNGKKSCDLCSGRKKVTGMGGMDMDCPKCSVEDFKHDLKEGGVEKEKLNNHKIRDIKKKGSPKKV